MHVPHVPGWEVAAAAAVLVIGAIIVIQPRWAPSTTPTADEAAAAHQAYRAGERAAVVPVEAAAAHQAYRAGERAVIVTAEQAAAAHQAYRAGERATLVTDPAAAYRAYRAGEREALVSATDAWLTYRQGERAPLGP